MEISCIVTVYNRLEYLRNVIKCLILQTRQVDELVIADDGSSETVLEAIKDLLPQCRFIIKHVYQKDLGFRKAKSLNNGVRESIGELLIFLDQDVIFGKNYIEDIASQIKRHNLAPLKVLWTTSQEMKKIREKLDRGEEYKTFLQEISMEQKSDRKKQNQKDLIRSWKFRLKLRKKPLTMGGAAYALFKEDYIKVNGYNEEFKGHGNEDLDFGYRLQRSGVMPMIINPQEAPIHMNHAKDITAGSNENKFENTIKNGIEDGYICEYGYNNNLDKDSYRVQVLKGNKA